MSWITTQISIFTDKNKCLEVQAVVGQKLEDHKSQSEIAVLHVFTLLFLDDTFDNVTSWQGQLCVFWQL